MGNSSVGLRRSSHFVCRLPSIRFSGPSPSGVSSAEAS